MGLFGKKKGNQKKQQQGGVASATGPPQPPAATATGPARPPTAVPTGPPAGQQQHYQPQHQRNNVMTTQQVDQQGRTVTTTIMPPPQPSQQHNSGYPQHHVEHAPPPQQQQQYQVQQQYHQQQQKQPPPQLKPPPVQYQQQPQQQQQRPPNQGNIMSTPQSFSAESTSTPASGEHNGSSVTNLPVGDERLATVEITRELVKKFISDIWNRGEIELIPQVCHPSLRFNGHVGMDRVGHEGFSRMVTTVREALTDYHCGIHSMVVETNKAFCRLKFTGKHTGNLLGYPPTGKTVVWMGASEFTCKNGKIYKVWELGDVKSLEDQLRSTE